jgi:hypothetical protein
MNIQDENTNCNRKLQGLKNETKRKNGKNSETKQKKIEKRNETKKK